MTEVLGERLLSRVPFRELGFSRLFSDYCEAAPEAVSFYGSHFLNKSAIADSLEKASLVNRDGRSVLLDVLHDQNERWHAPHKTHQNIRLLESDHAACVVTGQQLGLFVSPLYTIYKSLTAIQLAAAWSSSKQPVVPVFWLADEDHDLEEISQCFVPSITGIPTPIVYPERSKGNAIPTGRILLDEGITSAIDHLAEILPGTGDSAFLIESLRDCYRPGTSFADAFASFVHVLLPDSGLIIISGDDVRLKRLVIPLFSKAVAEADELHALLETSSREISRDYHAQLHLRNTNLFVMSGGQRLGLDRTGSGYSMSGSVAANTLDEVLTELANDPASFSPNVVLRPLYQDSILPTAAYVGGPGEVAYFGQIRAAYDWANVHMPIIYPRASLSLVDGAAARLLENYRLTFSDLRLRPEELFGQVVSREMIVDSQAIVARTHAAVEVAMKELAEPVGQVDVTLKNSVEAIRQTIHNRLEKLEKKILREEKRKHSTTGERIDRSTSFLFPSGKPQERVLAPAYFAGRFGRDYFMRLLEDLDVDTSQHFVLRA